MSDSESKEKPGFADPLLGEPVGDALDRNQVDGLGFSTKQEKRPQGMSRAQYLESMPGETTAPFLTLAGLRRWERLRWIIGGLLLFALIALAAAWWIVSRPPPA